MYPQELLFKLKKNTHINKQATTTTKKQEKSKRKERNHVKPYAPLHLHDELERRVFPNPILTYRMWNLTG